jgi:hypothetical protein
MTAVATQEIPLVDLKAQYATIRTRNAPHTSIA